MINGEKVREELKSELSRVKGDPLNVVDGLKALPKAEGTSGMFVAGEPENRNFDDRSRTGIPLPVGTSQQSA